MNSSKENGSVRSALRIHDVRHWELAEALGISEATLCKRLRRELPPAEKREMISLIKRIQKEKCEA